MLALQVPLHGEVSGPVIYSRLSFSLLYCVILTVSDEVYSRNLSAHDV